MFVDPVALKALQNMLAEIEAVMSQPSAPYDRDARCLELVQVAKALANDMMRRATRVQ